MHKNAVIFIFAMALKIGVLTLVFAENVNAKPVPSSFADLVEEHSSSVVNISIATKPKSRKLQQFQSPFSGHPFFDEFFDEFLNGIPLQQMPSQSLGSGVMISADGYAITNHHVVDKAEDIIVKFNEGDKEYKAELVGADPKNDIALLKIDAKNLPHSSFGDSDAVRVGDWVMAIGNPFGLGGSVSVGIISARGRNINQGPYDDFLQTDAAINPGNSGGPLFNMNGEIVGINTAILSRSGGSQGIGFAIPANTIKALVEQLKEHGRPVRGWLGVRVQPVTKELAEALDMKARTGALVAGVMENSPADKSGFKNGDVITLFDGKKIHDMQDLPKIVAETKVGKSVKVDVLRGDDTIRLTVNIEELDEDEDYSVSLVGKDEDEGFRVDGMVLSELTDETRQVLGVDAEVTGVLVERIEPKTRAAHSRLRPGDVLLQVNKQDVRKPKDVKEALDMKKDKNALLLIYRNGDTSFIALKKVEKD